MHQEKALKKALIFFGSMSGGIALLFGSVFGYVHLTQKKPLGVDGDNVESLLSDGKTKFPITDYVYFPQESTQEEEKLHTEELKKVFEKEEKKDEKDKSEDNRDSLKKALEETVQMTNPNNLFKTQPAVKKYSESIFDPPNTTQELRENLLSIRNSASLKIDSQKNANAGKKIVLDFGDGKFSNQPSVDVSTNETKLYRTITANKKIPAILIDAISSDLSGKITAQVEDDVFASMGNAVLIPKGSQVIGFYNNNNQIGVNRLQVVWSEIITPQGVDILLTDASNADVTGKSGLPGKINNKYWERYGLALTLSTLANAITITVANQTAKVPNYQTQQILSQSGQGISSIMQNIINEQIKINPVIEVNAGSRIFINPGMHMWFPEPKDGEIMVKYFRNVRELNGEERNEQ